MIKLLNAECSPLRHLRIVFVFSGSRSISIRVFIGEVAHLPCEASKTVITPVDWLYQPSPDARGNFIVSMGHLTNGDFEGRLSINGSTLIINNVKKEDGGVFTCVEDSGTGTNLEHRVVLNVEGKSAMNEFHLFSIGISMYSQIQVRDNAVDRIPRYR